MKDSISEFEDLNGRIEKLFEGLGWMNPLNYFKDKPKHNQANTTYSGRGQALNKHLAGIESGEECALGQSNGRFVSEPGQQDAHFYSIKKNKLFRSGYVKNIKPFLDNAKISKRFLRCYDLQKDSMKIGWLFDGEFNAEMLDWDIKKRKVIFQGTWKMGAFNGIMSPNTNQPKPPITKQYFVLISGQEVGPYTAGDIVKSFEKGKLTADSIVRPEDSSDYIHIKDDKTLSFLTKSIPKKPNNQKVTPKKSLVAKPVSKRAKK